MIAFLVLLTKIAFVKRKKMIYADYASATPIDKKVLNLVNVVEKKFWHNPSSIHSNGVEAKKLLIKTRENFALLINALPDEIVFTSSSSETNNLAIKGVVENFFIEKNKNKKAKVFLLPTDHPSLLEVGKSLKDKAGISFLGVNSFGMMDLKCLREEMKKNPTIISFGFVNGELGIIQNVKEIMKIVRHQRKASRSRYPLVHIDATHAFNTLEVKVNQLGVDLMTIDSSKIYGPKGASALFVKRGVELEPQILGGNHENGRRAGTENLPAIVGFEKALSIAVSLQKKEHKRLSIFYKKFLKEIKKNFPEALINGGDEGNSKVPNILNVCFPEINAEQAVLVLDAKGIKASSSSSCLNLLERPNSYVVETIRGGNCKESSLRFSFGRFTSGKDIKKIISALKIAVKESKNKRIVLA